MKASGSPPPAWALPEPSRRVRWALVTASTRASEREESGTLLGVPGSAAQWLEDQAVHILDQLRGLCIFSCWMEMLSCGSHGEARRWERTGCLPQKHGALG